MLGKNLKIDWIGTPAARHACENWHYSGSLPSGKLVKIGVWEDGSFVGAIIFGRGTSPQLGDRYNLAQTECVELVRIAFRPHKVQISQAVSIALKMLKKSSPGLRLVVSFASQDEDHHGGIYQAGNWIYSGTTLPQDGFFFRGKRATDRQISEHVRETRLVRAELERRGIIRRLKTKPKHRYLMPLDKKMRRLILPLSENYPKRVK
jgi:hypothetical protein